MRKTSLMLLALFVLAPLLAWAGDDPEPPARGGPELRKLRGKWTVMTRKFRGKEVPTPKELAMTYEFDGDKVTVKNARTEYVAKVKLDAKARPATLELTREDTKATTKMAFKVEKGELY